MTGTRTVPESGPPTPAQAGNSYLGDRSALAARLYSRLVPDPETGCLLWTGYIQPSGYGRIRVGGRMFYVHRVVWELEKGPIPEGFELDHVRARGCVHKHCANVEHLEPVTHRINMLRGPGITAANAVKTHCAAGHEFDLLNTCWRADGRRDCRACNRERTRAGMRRLRARAAGDAR